MDGRDVRAVEQALEIQRLQAQNKRLREALRDLVEAEWMVSHDWGGDRNTVYEQANAALSTTEAVTSEKEKEI